MLIGDVVELFYELFLLIVVRAFEMQYLHKYELTMYFCSFDAIDVLHVSWMF